MAALVALSCGGGPTPQDDSALEAESGQEAQPSAVETESAQEGRESALYRAPGEDEGSTLPEIEHSPSKARSGRIAYAHGDGRIITVNSDGSDPVTISPGEGFFTWPMWSPDGSQVVFSGSEFGNDAFAPLAMYSYDVAKNEGRVIYANEPDMGLILNNMPH